MSNPFRNLFDDWIQTPESIYYSVAAFIIAIILSLKFLISTGPIILIPLFFAFFVTILLTNFCDNTRLSNYWLFILHCFSLQKFFHLVTHSRTFGISDVSGFIDIVLLLGILVISRYTLTFVMGFYGFPIFTLVWFTDILYCVNYSVFKISFVEVFVFWSFILQIAMSVINQVIKILVARSTLFVRVKFIRKLYRLVRYNPTLIGWMRILVL